jgi:hypothetical protein
MPDDAQDSRNGHETREGDDQSLAEQSHTSLAAQTADHVRQILTAAEAGGERMRELAERERREIEEQALRRLEAADRVAELADERMRRVVALGEAVVELGVSIRTEMNEVTAGLERAEAGRRRVEGLAEALREEIAQVHEATAEPPGHDGPERVPAPAAPAENRAGGSHRPPADEQRSTGARERLDDVNHGKDARLVALHMAMGGRTRSEVEAKLARGSAESDLEEILDEVFGAGTAGSHTIDWRASSPAEGVSAKSGGRETTDTAA